MVVLPLPREMEGTYAILMRLRAHHFTKLSHSLCGLQYTFWSWMWGDCLRFVKEWIEGTLHMWIFIRDQSSHYRLGKIGFGLLLWEIGRPKLTEASSILPLQPLAKCQGYVMVQLMFVGLVTTALPDLSLQDLWLVPRYATNVLKTYDGGFETLYRFQGH